MALNIKQLLSLADRLDGEGQYNEADKIGEMVKKLLSTAEESNDEEFRKQLMEEGFENPQVQVGFPQEVDGQSDTSQKESELPSQGPKEKSELEKELLNDSVFVSKLSGLVGLGWHVFRPGDLEQWMAEKDYIKAPELPGMRITDKDIEDENKEASVKNADDGSFPHGILDLESKERIQEESKPLGYAPGTFDLASTDRLGPEEMAIEERKNEIRKVVDAFLSNPSSESNENLQSKIIQYVEMAESKLSNNMSDTDLVNEINKIEQEKDTRWAMQIKLFEKLASMADRLDSIGATKEAGLIDGFIQKHAELDDILDYQGEDKNSEQSKRYDSKYHHSLQIREPKTKKERVDREGRDKHHIDTMQNVEASALSTRYCPKHIGVMTGRIGENTYQCPIDGATFNSELGWTDHDGNEYPGGSIAGQTPDSSGYEIPHRIFDSRENTLNRVN